MSVGPLLAVGDGWGMSPEYQQVVTERTRRTTQSQVILPGAESPVPARASKGACTTGSDSLGSPEHMYVADRHKGRVTTAETGALRAVVDVLWEEAQELPATSPVRAWLLKIHSPLASFLGVRPLRLAPPRPPPRSARQPVRQPRLPV